MASLAINAALLLTINIILFVGVAAALTRFRIIPIDWWKASRRNAPRTVATTFTGSIANKPVLIAPDGGAVAQPKTATSSPPHFASV